MSSKQDLQGARTVAQLEQKYYYDKRFAEIMGVATGAQDKADDLEERLNNALTSEEIFNILTDNGELQGLFRGEDGELYINAQYIVALEYLFAKDIEMSGKFTYKTMAYLPPEQPELDTLQKHILGIVTIPADKLPLYDFNGDGKYSSGDLARGSKYMRDPDYFAEWPQAVETEVTLTIDLKNPQKAFRITGTNMWGRDIDSYMGVQGVSVKHTETVDYVVERGNHSTCDSKGNVTLFDYEKWASGKAVMWGSTQPHFANDSVLESNFDYPFPFVDTPRVFPAINSEDNLQESLYLNAKAYSYQNSGRAFVHNPQGSFTSSKFMDVSLFVIGRWK